MENIISPKFISKLETLQLTVKDNVAGLFGGSHRNKNKGSSCEFADHKLYEAGDDIHRMDWALYARSDTLYVKQFLDERQMHTKIYIDGSLSMDYGDKKKSTYALQLAATLAYLSVNSMDKVSIYVIHNGQTEELISRLVGKDSFLNQINVLNSVQFLGDCDISHAIMNSSVGYGDGMSILISDFLTDNDYKTAIDYLRSKKRDVLLLQVLSPDEINPKYNGRFTFFDSENPLLFFKKNITTDILRAYQRALDFIREDLTNYCHSREAEYLQVCSSDSLEDFVFNHAMKKEVIR